MKIRKYYSILMCLSIFCSCANSTVKDKVLSGSSIFTNSLNYLPNSFYSTYSEMGNWIPTYGQDQVYYLYNPQSLEESEGKLSDVDKNEYLSTLYGNWSTTENNRFIATEIDFEEEELDSSIKETYLYSLKSLNEESNLSLTIDEKQISIDQEHYDFAEISIYSVPFVPMETGLINLDENEEIHIYHFGHANEGMVEVVAGTKKLMIKNNQVYYSTGEKPEFIYLIQKGV